MTDASATPLVSVITICRNAMPYVRDCIESLLAQDYPRLEIVVQDGASTDGTCEVLRGYGDRIRLVSTPDTGHGDAMNRALQRCTGEIIGTCNADDLLLPNAVAWAVGHLADAKVGAVYGDYLVIDERGEILSGPHSGPAAFDLARVMCVEDVIPMQSAFFRRSALDRAGLLSGGWLPKLCEDFVFWLNLGMVARVERRPGVISRYRMHRGSGTYQPDLWTRIYKAKREVIERFLLQPSVPFALRSLRSRALGGLALSVAGMFLHHFDDAPSGLDYIRLAREEQPDDQHVQHLFETIRLWMVPIGRYLVGATEALLSGRKEEGLERLQQLSAVDCWLPEVKHTLKTFASDPRPFPRAECSPGSSRPAANRTDRSPGPGGRFEWSTARPLVDIILPGPPGHPFSWCQREGWAHALIRSGMLNQVHWAWDNLRVIDRMMQSLSRSEADFVIAMSCDHHMPYLHDTPEKAEFWKTLHMPVVCHCAERILNSPFPDSERKTRAAIDVYDAFVYIDELAEPIFRASGKPALWVPQYVDEALFRRDVPYEHRVNRVFFRGQVANFGVHGAYRARARLLAALKDDPSFEISEAYRPLLTPRQAAAMKAGYRFVLNAPANCSGYSSALYEAMASGCAVFQYELPMDEVRSRALFVPGRHYISYAANDPADLSAKASQACRQWQDYSEVARVGMEECLTHHTIGQRLTEVADFVSRHWGRISRRGVGVPEGNTGRSAPVSATVSCPQRTTDRRHDLPVHFFTIVLNGEPFIRHHIRELRQLPFRWHWHIVEGIAGLVHDTAWSRARGGRITAELHADGLSTDGTSAYLDCLSRDNPEITLYRKAGGQFWDGKLEMVNTPLAGMTEECLLWQLDADELWTAEQVAAAREMFMSDPDRTAAFYRCRYFVGPNLVTTTQGTYGNRTGYEWLRTWRYRPGDRWASHEPPRLVRPNGDGRCEDVGRIRPFLHSETESRGLVFNHHAYVTEAQLRFKEIYYGYAGALESWKALQSCTKFPVLLRDYFPWVADGTLVDRAAPVAAAVRTRAGGRRERILWVRTDAIGDAVLSAGMLQHLRSVHPEGHVVVACQEHLSPLFESCPFVDEVVGIDKARCYRGGDYLRRLGDDLSTRKFTHAYNPIFSREPLADYLVFASAAPVRVGLEGDLCNICRKERDSNSRHYTTVLPNPAGHSDEMDHQRRFLREIGAPAKPLGPAVWTSPEDDAYAERLSESLGLVSERTIAFFPGAQSRLRVYPAFAPALRRAARDFGWTIIGLGSRQESAWVHTLLEDIGAKFVNLCGRTTLRQLAALLRRCKLGIGAESGPAHIACAVGTPHVVVVGGGHFGRFMPFSPLTSLVCLPLECYGCNWRCRYSEPVCIRGINPSVLEGAIQQTCREPAPVPRVFIHPHDAWRPGNAGPAWACPPFDFVDAACIPVNPEDTEANGSRLRGYRTGGLQAGNGLVAG